MIQTADNGTQSGGFEHLERSAKSLLDAIDEKEVACFVALKNPEEGPEAKKRKERMEAQKSAIVETRKVLTTTLIDRDYKEITSKVDEVDCLDKY